MVWIAGSTVGAGGAGNLIFNNIPSGFTHLQFRCFMKSTRSDIAIGFNPILAQFNDDTANNYANHMLRGDGSSATSSATAPNNYAYFGQMPGSVSTEANIFSSSVIDILDYSNTNKNKTVRVISGYDTNGASGVQTALLMSTAWFSTAAITKINVRFDAYGNPFAQFSRVDLYGITSSQVTGA